MTKNHGSPRTDVIDELVAVDIAQVGAICTCEKDRVTTHTFKRSNWGIDSARDALQRSLHQGCGCISVHKLRFRWPSVVSGRSC